MPLYEYLCEECTERFTLLQPMNASAGETACPKCGRMHVRRLFSAFAARTDGSGESFGSSDPSSGGGCGSSCGCH